MAPGLCNACFVFDSVINSLSVSEALELGVNFLFLFFGFTFVWEHIITFGFEIGRAHV